MCDYLNHYLQTMFLTNVVRFMLHHNIYHDMVLRVVQSLRNKILETITLYYLMVQLVIGIPFMAAVDIEFGPRRIGRWASRSVINYVL